MSFVGQTAPLPEQSLFYGLGAPSDTGGAASREGASLESDDDGFKAQLASLLSAAVSAQEPASAPPLPATTPAVVENPAAIHEITAGADVGAVEPMPPTPSLPALTQPADTLASDSTIEEPTEAQALGEALPPAAATEPPAPADVPSLPPPAAPSEGTEHAPGHNTAAGETQSGPPTTTGSSALDARAMLHAAARSVRSESHPAEQVGLAQSGPIVFALRLRDLEAGAATAAQSEEADAPGAPMTRAAAATPTAGAATLPAQPTKVDQVLPARPIDGAADPADSQRDRPFGASPGDGRPADANSMPAPGIGTAPSERTLSAIEQAAPAPAGHDNAETISAPFTVAAAGDSEAAPERRSKMDAAAPGTAERVLASEPVAGAEPASTPVRHIALQVGDRRIDGVRVDVVERRGQVHVAVRTSNESLSGPLRDQLGDLVADVERRGFLAETWTPAAAESQRSREESSGDARHHARQDSGDGHPSGNQQRRQSQDKPQWLREFESLVRGQADSNKEHTPWLRQ